MFSYITSGLKPYQKKLVFFSFWILDRFSTILCVHARTPSSSMVRPPPAAATQCGVCVFDILRISLHGESSSSLGGRFQERCANVERLQCAVRFAPCSRTRGRHHGQLRLYSICGARAAAAAAAASAAVDASAACARGSSLQRVSAAQACRRLGSGPRWRLWDPTQRMHRLCGREVQRTGRCSGLDTLPPRGFRFQHESKKKNKIFCNCSLLQSRGALQLHHCGLESEGWKRKSCCARSPCEQRSRARFPCRQRSPAVSLLRARLAEERRRACRAGRSYAGPERSHVKAWAECGSLTRQY